VKKEEEKEAEAKRVKVIDNAADRNQQIADKARAEAFETVVSQETDEKEGVDTITGIHDAATAEAHANEIENISAYDYQRRGAAPAARDSLRFVDTENEGLDGVKYGDRYSLSQQRTNQAQLYQAMNGQKVNPAVFTSVASVVAPRTSLSQLDAKTQVEVV
jgi:hypothetical protein